MESILISINPKHCANIVSGKKTIEIRKSSPLLASTPFKCFIFCRKYEPFHPTCYCWVSQVNYIGNGKVVGEFICDDIAELDGSFFDEQEERDTEEISEFLRDSCMTYSELCDYVGDKTFYAWHISDLVVYDKPKELRDFVSVHPLIKCPHDFVYAQEVNHG